MKPLFLQLKAVNPSVFYINAVETAIFPMKRCEPPLFCRLMAVTPKIFQLNAVNAVIFSAKCR